MDADLRNVEPVCAVGRLEMDGITLASFELYGRGNEGEIVRDDRHVTLSRERRSGGYEWDRRGKKDSAK